MVKYASTDLQRGFVTKVISLTSIPLPRRSSLLKLLYYPCGSVAWHLVKFGCLLGAVTAVNLSQGLYRRRGNGRGSRCSSSSRWSFLCGPAQMQSRSGHVLG